jgi:hypothetical protein
MQQYGGEMHMTGTLSVVLQLSICMVRMARSGVGIELNTTFHDTIDDFVQMNSIEAFAHTQTASWCRFIAADITNRFSIVE